MALTPSSDKPAENRAQRLAAEHDVLMREVDEAVRKDRIDSAARKYGLIAVAVAVLGLVGFGGYLFWHEQRESGLEESSEQLVLAFDELEAGNTAAADENLAALAEQGGDTAAAIAVLTRAGIALQDGRKEEAARLYQQVADNTAAPEVYRNLAAIRSVAANYENMEPQAVVDRLQPLAVPGNPWFGSAGEIVAMAYLDQDRADLAGPLFGEIAKDEDVPQTLRSRARQMAGLLGVDAIEDVESTLEQMREEGSVGPESAPAQ